MDQNHDDQDTRPVESTETDATETVPETTTEVPVNATTEETTATEETPAEETHATEETPAEETPETEATEETTAAEETAAAEETPAEETAAAEETPETEATEETTAAEETPATEETEATEETAAAEETPETEATEETTAAEETPETEATEETAAAEKTPVEETTAAEETPATEETAAAEETAAETAADEGRDANTEAAEGGEAGASNSEWELVEAVDANEEDVEKSSQSAVVVDAVVEEELADYDTDVEEAEEVDEPIAPQPTKVPAIDDSAVTAEPQFDEDELAAMEADSAAVEAASHDTEKATRARIATLRKSYFTARALKRQANARVAEAIDAAAKEPEGEITAEPYGPKSDIIDQLKEKAVALETEASKLEADIANHENAQKRLGPQYLGAIKALFMLDRFEQFLVNLSEHVKAQNANADKPQGEEVEAKVLEHVRELVTKRNKEVERLETIKERVRKTAADLRRGQVITRASKTPSLGGNPTQQSGSPTIGRSSVAREDDSAIANASEEVSELRGYNELVGKEVEDLTDALLRLTKEKSALSVKLTTTKASLRKAEMRLNDELKQKSLRLRADTKAIEELHRTNAGLISTIETLMHQLNNEYYGAGERPNALSPSSKKAIAAKGATSSTAATSVAASPAASPEEEDVEEETNVNEEEAVATGENEAEATEEHEAAAPADEVAVAEEATA